MYSAQSTSKFAQNCSCTVHDNISRKNWLAIKYISDYIITYSESYLLDCVKRQIQRWSQAKRATLKAQWSDVRILTSGTHTNMLLLYLLLLVPLHHRRHHCRQLARGLIYVSGPSGRCCRPTAMRLQQLVDVAEHGTGVTSLIGRTSARGVASHSDAGRRYPLISWYTPTFARTPARSATSASTRNQTWRNTPMYIQVATSISVFFYTCDSTHLYHVHVLVHFWSKPSTPNLPKKSAMLTHQRGSYSFSWSPYIVSMSVIFCLLP